MDVLSRAQLTASAKERAGLSDFGDLQFEEALDMLIFSLEREAKLDAARRHGAAEMIVSKLIKGLRRSRTVNASRASPPRWSRNPSSSWACPAPAQPTCTA